MSHYKDGSVVRKAKGALNTPTPEKDGNGRNSKQLIRIPANSNKRVQKVISIKLKEYRKYTYA